MRRSVRSTVAVSSQGGSFQGDFTTCADADCPQPKGACCFDDGSCKDLTEEQCDAEGGVFQGDFTTCSTTDCPQPPGACCFDDGSCVELTEEDCNAQGGVFQGDFTTCADADCPQPEGACCFDDGTCKELTEEDCIAEGGVYQGDFTRCDDVDCPQPEGACCFCDAQCEILTEDECEAKGGTFLGADTDCEGELFTIDFATEDDFSTPLVNGQAIDDEFGVLIQITSEGPHEGAVIFDSTPGGPNQGGPDNDLLVDLGNVLTLQSSNDPEQTVPGIFDVPNDTAKGGTLFFDFLVTAELLSIDLIDICPEPNESAVVTLIDSAGRMRSYDVPGGWTTDVTVEPDGFDTLDLTTLDPQVGDGGEVATASQDPDFSPTNVVRLEVWFESSGATDTLVFVASPCPPDACPLGACCLDDGSCVEGTEEFCDTIGGFYQGDDTMCVAGLCPQPGGACCLADGSCTEVSEDDCHALGGEYQGDHLTCADVDCPAPCPGDGDCCEPNGTPGCDDLACCEAVCAVDPFCCETEWDSICKDQAKQLCEVCTDDPCPGDGDCCVANGTPGCDDTACCEEVCLIDPHCCSEEWDSSCARKAKDLCSVCDDDPCPGDGDCCVENGTPGCDDVDCCEKVCALDPHCCEAEWDHSCAETAKAECSVCDGGACPGDGDCCVENGTPGCDDVDCCEKVCALDPFCCEVAWDGMCARKANDECSVCDGGACPGDGDCCEANGTPGCDDATCCETVCSIDAFCCENEWDSICKDQAKELCDVCNDGPCPGDGDCCDNNGTPGCDDAVCCETVCAADPFCCDNAWDNLCKEQAKDLCDVCGGGGGPCPGDGDCCTDNGTPGCDDASCCEAVCAADPFCCETAWDGICKETAKDICDVCH